ncbi:MAG: c-type cytochrome [Deltaproteobacteria bacterium]|nr:c-type cytochrome [Deltaproteobacteria bacterium]
MRIEWMVAAATLSSAAAAMLPACSTPQPASPSSPSGAEASDGKRLYEQRCATCHGIHGDGRGPTAHVYGSPAPRDFTRGLYEFRTTDAGKLPVRADLVRTIGQGIPGTTMPAWRSLLSPREIEAIAQYIESFSPRFAAEPESARAPIAIPPEPPPPSATDLEVGRMFYFTFRCWECHGVYGEGDGPAAATLADEWKRPIRPADLTRGVYKSGATGADLYRTIATGLDGTPMPTFRLAVVVGKEGLADLGKHIDKLDPAIRAKVTAFVQTLPTDEQIFALSDPDRAKFGERRLWLLTGYVKSLAHRGVFDWLSHDPSAP